MTIPKVWHIDYACGHSEDRDLSNKRVDQRAGFAEWLSGKDCFDCYKKKSAGTVSKELAAERAKKLETTAEWEEKSGLQPLDGSDKQIQWARVIRGEVLEGLYDLYVTSGEHDEEWFDHEILAAARAIATARWWIDNREMDLPAFLELLPAGAESVDATENPF